MQLAALGALNVKYKFKYRGFVSLLTTFSFLISLVSGIVLYFTPQGKIANWTNWTFWNLDKHTWGALHINSSLIFFIIVGFHIYYNWKLLVAYIKKRAKLAANLKLELIITLILSFFLVTASIYNIQPFKQIIRWNEDVKVYWAGHAEAQPPIPHMEEMTVTEFCQTIKISLEKFETRMTAKGWSFASDQTLEEIAKQHNISPLDIYKQVQPSSSSRNGGGGSSGSGGGWGRMTVEQICRENNIETNIGLENLARHGVHARSSDTMRPLAETIGVRPSEVVEIITGKKTADGSRAGQ